MGISDDVIGDVSNPSLLAVTLDPTLGLRRRKGRRLSNGDFPREIPIGDVIKLLSILNPLLSGPCGRYVRPRSLTLGSHYDTIEVSKGA